MLSKMKSPFAGETRSSLSNNTSQASDNEDEIDNDSNNNNSNNNNNNNINSQKSKRSQEDLLDIVETSRKRRISKDSADSLSNFIRWSFGHKDLSIQRLSSASPDRYGNQNKSLVDSAHDQVVTSNEDDILDDEDNWSNISGSNNNNNINQFNLAKDDSRFQSPAEKMLRQRQRNGGSSAENLALMKIGADRQVASGLLALSEGSRGAKRLRTRGSYSPQPIILGGSGARKSSSYLGNVVDRLHQQQQQQQQQQQHALEQEHQQEQQQQAAEQLNHRDSSSNVGLSYHLQQFLQQQTSLEDLCSSVGLDDGNQLVLAAAIHRALVDSVGPAGGANNSQAADSKSTGSTGASSGLSSTSSTHNPSSAVANSSSSPSGANLHLVDSLRSQNRAYNTRAAIQSLNSAPGAGSNQRHASSTTAINMSSRAQQQRHAQAAAALSALASAGSHSHQLGGNGPGSGSLGGAMGGSATPMVDFECDTCGSSFDDRHRLMQHQSIHLELKKDWFTETPVDEVMKIFNRRRGEFLCNTCNLRFEATFDYDKHNHSVHGQRPYCCQFCGNGTRTFRFWRQYLNHLYDHRYIFSCTIDDCDFTVNRRDSLRFHIFRFHLNCQLPQNQQHQQQIRFGHHHNMLLGANNCADSKWPTLDDDDNEEDMK